MINWFLNLFPNLIKNNTIVETLLFEVALMLDSYNKKLDKELNNDI